MFKPILLPLLVVLVSIDMVLCSGVVLQLVCVLLVVLLCAGGMYIRRKNKNGIWLSKQQYDDLHDLAKESILNRNI